MRPEMARWQYQGDTLRSTLAFVWCQCACDECWCVVALLNSMFMRVVVSGASMVCDLKVRFMWWRTQVSRHPFSMRPEMARWQYHGDTLRSTLAFVWCQECQSDECWCVVALLKSMFMRVVLPGGSVVCDVKVCFMWWRTQVSRHPFSMRPEMARWQYQGDTLRSTLAFVWCQECQSDECWCGVALLKSGCFYWVEAWYVMWRCASCDEGLKCHAIHFRWGLKWLVDNTKGTPWEAHWHSFGVRNVHVMNVDALLHSWKACSWGLLYRVQARYVMWRCASCDEGLKCHAIHFRWGLKWLDDNTKGTPWEAHWDSFGVRNAHVMNVDALLHFWKAGGSSGWKRGMWCEGVLHVMKDSSVTPSIFDEAWNGSLTIPRGHPEKHIGIRLVSGMPKWWMLMHCCTFEKRVVLPGGSVVCGVKVCFMWWRTQVSRHPFSMRPEMARWQYQGDTLRSTLAFVWCQECACDECWCVVALLKSMFMRVVVPGGSVVCDVKVCFMWWRTQVSRHPFSMRPEMARWQYQGDTLRSTLAFVWCQECACDECWCVVALLKSMFMRVVVPGAGTVCDVKVCFMWWRTQVSRHPFSMRPEMARWQYQGDTLRSTLAFVWCQECQSDECWCGVALLKCGWFYRLESWYVMWRCASCDEGLKCHAIHFRWGLKWLVDNTKGTPWEAHWHSFGVRNAKAMNVDALLHFWNAGGSGMWCEGVLHVMKDSSVTPSIFNEAWNGSLTVPRGHPKNHTTYLVISPSFCIHSLITKVVFRLFPRCVQQLGTERSLEDPMSFRSFRSLLP